MANFVPIVGKIGEMTPAFEPRIYFESSTTKSKGKLQMIDLNNTQLFTPIVQPETGVTIYILSRKVAPVQEAFYFSNASMTPDGRYLWFYCAFPPSGTGSPGTHVRCGGFCLRARCAISRRRSSTMLRLLSTRRTAV